MKSIRIKDENDLKKALNIRKEVFVKEQGVPEENEYDAYDNLNGECEHILVYCRNQPVGTGRFRVVDNVGKLERICVLESYRKYGIGKAIVKALEEVALEKGITKLKLHAQKQAIGFYEKLCYHSVSDEFLEENIPHVLMIKNLDDV